MSVYISLLRGINVGGKRMKMADVRDLYESLGFADVQSILASGNLAFRTDQADPAQIAQQIEAAIEKHYGFGSTVIMRTAEEIRAVVDHDPFSKAQLEQSKLCHVMFLQAEPTSAAMQKLRDDHNGPESIMLEGRELYLFYPDGSARSKLTTDFIEKRLKTEGTARNWNTTLKLHKLAEEYSTT